MLTIIRKKTVHIIKANIGSVAQQFSHRRTAVHATGRLSHQWHAAADQTMQQSGVASDQQHRAGACGRHVPAWLPRLHSPQNSRQDYLWATGLGQNNAVLRGPAVPWGSEVKSVATFHKVQYQRIKRHMVGCVYVLVPNFCGMFLPSNWKNWMTSV